MNRREFLGATAFGSVALAVTGGLHGAPAAAGSIVGPPGAKLLRELLREWGDGMLALQIDAPGDPARHGALRCPSCSFIHGRCMDAVYPFFHLAHVTGDGRYLEAGKRVFAWGDNVSQPDGSWTVIADPKSWAGITIFGAIALAETLHHHGGLLDEATRVRWTDRLRAAADYVHRTFTIDFTNINYPATATYGLHLFGTLLGEPAYLAHARELAEGVRRYFTSPNHLLFGEGKPSNARSARGLLPVDLGYNVEESLVALSLYAAEAGDAGFKALIARAWRSHLEFMLPDGGWDNSWGTRQAKWSYWGSRTCDGCQPGLLALADLDPVFGTAAVRNAELYRACTRDGLLHGGPHYADRGVPPCVHHTFTHAKAVAAVLDNPTLLGRFEIGGDLPRAIADGVKAFPELAVWLAARGPWRATVSAYDFIYKTGVLHATGGSLAMLWHERAGPLFAGSMAAYAKAEPNNMQDDPDGRADALTPRIEAWQGGRWYTQLYDLTAAVTPTESTDRIEFSVRTALKDEMHHDPAGGPVNCTVNYRVEKDGLTFRATYPGGRTDLEQAALVLPLISTADEAVLSSAGNRIEIRKASCVVVVEADVPIRIRETARPRMFSLTPGFEALPLALEFPSAGDTIECRISIRT